MVPSTLWFTEFVELGHRAYVSKTIAKFDEVKSEQYHEVMTDEHLTFNSTQIRVTSSQATCRLHVVVLITVIFTLCNIVWNKLSKIAQVNRAWMEELVWTRTARTYAAVLPDSRAQIAKQVSAVCVTWAGQHTCCSFIIFSVSANYLLLRHSRSPN